MGVWSQKTKRPYVKFNLAYCEGKKLGKEKEPSICNEVEGKGKPDILRASEGHWLKNKISLIV